MSTAYEDVINRIEQSGDIEPAIKILSWLFYAQEPLRMEALLEALVVEEGDRELQRDYMLKPTDVIDCCKSLVIHEISSGFVRFTHYTVEEFIGTIKPRLLPIIDLAKTCLNYLAISVFDEPYYDLLAFLKRAEQYKFSSYAAKYWGFYTSGEPEKSYDIQRAVVHVLRSELRRSALIQLSRDWFDRSKSETFFHMIVRAGLTTICSLILDATTTENEKSIFANSPQY